MPHLPPGIAFLLRVSWTFVALAAFTFLFMTWLRIPGFVVWVVTLASAPLLVAARIHSRYASIQSAAKRCGAVLAPKWDSRIPGDFDVMQEMMISLNNGYPGVSTVCVQGLYGDLRHERSASLF